MNIRWKQGWRTAMGALAVSATLATGGLVSATAVADDAPAATQTQATAAAQQCPAPADTTGSGTPAQKATVTASYTASWNNIAAVQDGVSVFSKGSNDQVWGTYSNNRPATQWLQYGWYGDVTLTGASISFWRDNDSDTAGTGVAVPQSWKLQTSTDGNTWTDVALKDGTAYTREKDKANAVEFKAPVTAKYLRATFTATTDGKTNAAIGVSDFAVTVTGDVPTNPKAGIAVLASDSFNVAISRETGAIHTLGNATDGPQCTNYVINPTTKTAGSKFNVDDSRWTGDIGTWTNGKAQNTGLSDQGRTVTAAADGKSVTVAYDPANTENRTGAIKDFALTERYTLANSGDGADGDVLDWNINVSNTSGKELTMDDLSLPMLMNSWWDSSSQDNIYEQNVSRHAYVAKDGSYIYWQRPSGTGPYLVMVPKEGTSLEFKDKAKPGEGTFAEVDPSWEGLVEFAIHSNHVQSARAGKIDGYLDASKLTLAANGSTDYGFTFRWAKDYDDLHNVLYQAGVVDAVSYPGYTVSQGNKATVAVRAKDGVASITPGGGKNAKAGADAKITKTATNRNGYDIYEIEFPSIGEQYVTVNFGKDGKRKSVMQYNSIKPIDQLIDTHADFVTTNQQAKDASKGYDGAFLQWNMAAAELVTRDSATMQGQSEWNKRWMAGGSDDLGLSPAAFLSEKNVDTPDKTQVEALDYYIDNFLLGYLQNERKSNAGVACTGDECNERTWNIYHWYDGTDGDRPSGAWNSGNVGEGGVTWRVMNAPHVWNTYFNMYRIASTYPELAKGMKHSAADYLDMAYNTANAFYNHDLDYKAAFLDNSAREMGAMGEGSIPEIIAALKASGKNAQADTLTQHAKDKLAVFTSKDYPFASEMSIDTTAFESTYTMAKLFGNTDLQAKTTYASLSARGTQPLWYYNGGDNRHMGESWWNLGYETQLGAWQQQAYLQNTSADDLAAAGFDADELMRSTYGAYMAGWSNINMGQISSDERNVGAASWQYQSEGGTKTAAGSYSMIPVQNHWWMWSGEADLGFWGALRTASANVVNDKIIGDYAYGATLTSGKDANGKAAYTIEPTDGVAQKAWFSNLGESGADRLGFELHGIKYTKATVAKDRTSVALTVSGAEKANATVALTGLASGSGAAGAAGAAYTVAIDGGKPAALDVKDGAASVDAAALTDGKEHTIVIAPVVPASTDAALASLKVAGVSVDLEKAASAEGASVEVADPSAVTADDVEAETTDAAASKPVVVVKDAVVTVTVTAEDGTTKKTYTVKLTKKAPVVVPVESVTVSVDKAELTVGETAQVTATVAPENATDKTVAWASSDAKVATVSDKGVVTAVAPGTVEITATAGGKSGKVTITVKAKTEPTPECKPLTFSDVTATTPHKADIDWLACKGISTGWSTGENTAVFSPMGPVVRQDMAAFLYRLAGSPEYTPSDEDRARFTDVDESTPHYKEVLWLAHAGIADGFKQPDGSFQFGGNRAVVRQDMAAFLKRLADYRKADPALGEGVGFTDVDEFSPHAEEIAWLARTGVAGGFDDGTFGGMRLVVRQDMAAFLHRMDANVLTK